VQISIVINTWVLLNTVVTSHAISETVVTHAKVRHWRTARHLQAQTTTSTGRWRAGDRFVTSTATKALWAFASKLVEFHADATSTVVAWVACTGILRWLH